MKKEINEAFKDSLPIMAGYIVLGSGFGIVANSYGFNILVPILMSLFIYAGSMEYLALSLISVGTSLISTFITTIVVNLRHLFYGISMLEKYNDLNKSKIYTIFALPDEHVDSFMSLSSISGRMTASIALYAATSKLMIELDRSVKDIAGIPYDVTKI